MALSRVKREILDSCASKIGALPYDSILVQNKPVLRFGILPDRHGLTCSSRTCYGGIHITVDSVTTIVKTWDPIKMTAILFASTLSKICPDDVVPIWGQIMETRRKDGKLVKSRVYNDSFNHYLISPCILWVTAGGKIPENVQTAYNDLLKLYTSSAKPKDLAKDYAREALKFVLKKGLDHADIGVILNELIVEFVQEA